MKEVAIIGAGPAGLTAAYELQKRAEDYHVTVFEEGSTVGGISRTVEWNGNRMDMGPHRFFSKDPEVNRWWDKILPMRKRKRISRILFNGKFFDYPISLKPETIRNLGFANAAKCVGSYIRAMQRRLPEDNLENYYINSFGRELYSMFFEYYTENLWGRHPSEIDASWGAQRTKGLSISGIVKDVAGRALHLNRRRVNTSLIDEFRYPELGAGEMWESAAVKISELGGDIVLNAHVTGFEKKGSEIVSLRYEKDGEMREHSADIFISSMPVKDLVEGMNDVPENIRNIAEGLPYRSYMILGVLVKKLALEERGGKDGKGGVLPDSWIYVQDRTVKMGRFIIFNNWSEHMLKDPENTVLIGLEYFCTEGDDFWNQDEEEFVKTGIAEMIRTGIIADASDVIDTHTERVKKAYPAYFDTYAEIDKLTEYLDSIGNLYCVGRNGQHRYNNMDHSMMTSLEAVRCIITGNADRSPVWNVNTEKEYHEER